MNTVTGEGADEAWRNAARLFEEHIETSQQKGRGGETLELLHTLFQIDDPKQRWVVNRLPPMNPAFALAEIVWILSGRNDSAFLNFWNPRLPKYSGRGPLYYGAYGQRLRYRFGIDQIRYAFESLDSNPDSRQVVLQIWDAASDLPIENGEPRSEDIPCNVCSLLKIRNNHLEWVQIMRSNDLVLGWPHNVVQFTTLQEMMAGWLRIAPGSYSHLSDSLHVYIDQLEGMAESPSLAVDVNEDRWNLSYTETINVIEDMGRRMDEIRSNPSNVRLIAGHAKNEYSSQAATNALRIISADAIRRSNDLKLAEETATMCTNPILRQLWARWLSRTKSDL